MDQRPPVLDMGSYYRKWASHQREFGNRKILTVKVYEVSVEGNGIKVENLGNLTADEIKRSAHIAGEKDLYAVKSTLMKFFEEKFTNLEGDENLKDLDMRKYLPPGYKDGGFWKFDFSYFASYYNQVFHKQFSKYLFKQMLREEVVNDLNKSNRFWVKVKRDGEDMIVMLHFARKA